MIRIRLFRVVALVAGLLATVVPAGAEQDRASSLEQAVAAIEAMRVAVGELSPAKEPAAWAKAQNRLGGAYFDMARNLEGEERRNLLGQAIDAYREALKVLTPERELEDWTIVRYNLANALLDDAEMAPEAEGKLLRGEAVGVLESIAAKVPAEYATLRGAIASRLGDAYAGLGPGAAPDAVAGTWRKAAESYGQALGHLPADAAAQRRVLHYRQALAWQQSAIADRDHESWAKAFAAFDQAAKNIDAKTSPGLWTSLHRDWADGQLEFATSLEGGAAAAELGRAVANYELALASVSREQGAATWRDLQTNLGIARLRLAQESATGAADLLNGAVEALTSALNLTDRAKEPMIWVRIQYNLGFTFRLLGRLQGSETAAAIPYFERAVAYLRATLDVPDREKDPRAWAESRAALALTLQDLARRKLPAEAAPLVDEASALLKQVREVMVGAPPSAPAPPAGGG